MQVPKQTAAASALFVSPVYIRYSEQFGLMRVASGSINLPMRQVQRVLVEADEAGRRLDNFLLSRLDVPRQAVYRWIRTGQVRVNRGRARVHQRLKTGDEVRIPPWDPSDQRISRTAPPNISIETLYKDSSVWIVNKPAGLAVHSGSRLGFGLIDVLRAGCSNQEKLELAHRLDRGSSGCLVLARTHSALRTLQQQFRRHTVKKVYWALAKGVWKGGERTVSEALKINRTQARNRKTVVDPEGRQTRTSFRVLEQFSRACLLEVGIETGRTHQIRVHASSIGHPLVGDERYGDRTINQWAKHAGYRRLFLHAQEIGLQHPESGDALVIQAPLDDAYRDFLSQLREQEK